MSSIPRAGRLPSWSVAVQRPGTLRHPARMGNDPATRGQDHPLDCPGRLSTATVRRAHRCWRLRAALDVLPAHRRAPGAPARGRRRVRTARSRLAQFWQVRAVERPAPELRSNEIAGWVDGAQVAGGGWRTETSHGRQEVVMLRGENGRVLSRVYVDGLHTWPDGQLSVLEVEGGGSLQNNRLMKDLFEALIIPAVGYLAIGAAAAALRLRAVPGHRDLRSGHPAGPPAGRPARRLLTAAPAWRPSVQRTLPTTPAWRPRTVQPAL